MKFHRLETNTLLNTPVKDAWAFFSNPHNLDKITPGDMGFKVVSSHLPDEIYSGLLIKYVVRPLLRLPLEWVTEIKEVEAGRFFVDEQLKGPFKYWRHEHVFTARADGAVLMEDKVTYALPLGWLGRLVALSMVKAKLASIFRFRYEAIEEKFPGSKLLN